MIHPSLASIMYVCMSIKVDTMCPFKLIDIQISHAYRFTKFTLSTFTMYQHSDHALTDSFSTGSHVYKLYVR